MLFFWFLNLYNFLFFSFVGIAEESFFEACERRCFFLFLLFFLLFLGLSFINLFPLFHLFLQFSKLLPTPLIHLRIITTPHIFRPIINVNLLKLRNILIRIHKKIYIYKKYNPNITKIIIQ